MTATIIGGYGIWAAGAVAVLALGLAVAALIRWACGPLARALGDDPAADAEIDAAPEAEVKRLIERLPEPRRVLLMLHYADGLSVDEIAEVTDMDRHRVDAHLQAAKGMIADEFERHQRRGS